MTKQHVIKGLATGLSAILLSSTLSANSFDLGINNDTVEVGLERSTSSNGQISANYLYTEAKGKTAEIGFQTTNTSAGNRIALGAKFVKLWAEKRDDGHAVSLGGEFRMPLAPSVSAAIQAYYAPSILSFSGVSRHYNLDAKLLYQVIPTADLYLGYRNVTFKFDNDANQTLDQSFYLGAEVKF